MADVAIRASAAAGALGAPKVISSKPQPAAKMPRYLNKGNGKMETAQQMGVGHAKAPAQRVHTQGPVQHAPTSRGSVSTPAPQSTPAAKSWIDMNPGELQKYATQQVAQNTKAELVPYHQRAGEITGTENTVANRYQGYGQAADKLISNTQGEQAASAKTFENQAADAASKALSSIDTTGQGAATNNGGYVDPQLRSQLASEAFNAGGVGAAQQATASTLGQNEQNFLANTRAAAAQRVVEGQKGIASTFGKQRAENQGKEGQLLARQAGAVTKLDTELGQKQFTNRATEQGLGIKLKTLGQKAEEAGAKNALTARGQNLAVERNRENAQQRETASQRTAALNSQKQSFGEWAKREDLKIKGLSVADKATYDKAQIRVKEATAHGKPPNPKEGRKFMNELATASTIAAANGVRKGVSGKALQEAKVKAEEAMSKAAKGSTVNRELVAAAMNLAYYGRLSTVDQAVARSYGLTPEIRPEWFRTK